MIREERIILGRVIREERTTLKTDRKLADKARDLLGDLTTGELWELLGKMKDENNSG